MAGLAQLIYGVLAYAAFLGSFFYAIAFVGDFSVPWTINAGPDAGLIPALLIDTCLLLAFAIPHSVMARQGFKRWWTRIIPEPIERSTYVLASSLLLILLYWQWRPIPTTIWDVENAVGAAVLQGVFWLGWLTVLGSTFLIDHFDLFGLRQVWLRFRGRSYEPPQFQTPGLYRYVRHPLLLGFVLAFWATPVMTVGHLLFAVATTGYILVGMSFEERDLVRFHGEAYERYRNRVRGLIPLPRKGDPVEGG